jgi:hypothetical protein
MKGIMGTLHEDACTFMEISCLILLRMRNVSDKTCREIQNTPFMFNNLFLNVKNMEELERPQMTI